MARRSIPSRIGSLVDGFATGYDLVGRVARDIDMQKVAQAKPTTDTGFTQDQGDLLRAAGESGQYDVTWDAERGHYTVRPKAQPGQDAQPPQTAQAQAGAPEQRDPRVMEGVVSKPQPVMEGIVRPQQRTQFLGHTYDKPLDESGISRARQMAMAGVLEKHGDPTAGLRMRSAIRQDDEAAQNAADKARRRSDDQALRDAMAPEGGDAGDDYLKRVAPRAVRVLLQQGKTDEAARFQKFVESESGRQYTGLWMDGVRRHAVGDTAGALKSFETLYNSQLYGDGQTVKLTPLEGDQAYQVDLIGADGKAVGSKQMPVADLLNQAIFALEPSRAVELMAQQAERRRTEQATTDRQIEVETLRQAGRDDIEARREDARDARLERRLQAQTDQLERRLGAQGGRGASGAGTAGVKLTAAQQRANAEIDAAREAIAGLDANEIRRRTTRTSDTGRDNPAYDPRIARAAALAARRKVGEDAAFDDRQAGPQRPPAPSMPDRADVIRRFRKDAAMENYKLGRDTANGVEVLDSAGKVVGYYR